MITRLLCFFSLVLLLSCEALAQCDAIPYAVFDYSFAPDGFTVLFQSATGGTECSGSFVYTWNFNDGTTSTEPNPIHTYTDEGVYRVRLTVALPPPCTQSVSHEVLITIRGGAPGILWVDIEGPTLAAECQQVFYNVKVVGGTPPYKYEWNMGDFYCGQGGGMGGSPCCGNPGTGSVFVGTENIGVVFASTGFFSTSISVLVTDARGKTEVAYLNNIRIKAGIQPLEVILKTINDCPNGYKINTPVIMLPDIQPLSAFEYPTNYLWDFGDGMTYLDNVDGGGAAVHPYALCGVYTVKLTVSDPSGSMQTTKQIVIRDTDCTCAGTGSTPPTPTWELSNGTGRPTLEMDYDPTSSAPSYTTISMLHNGSPCTGNYHYRWRWEFTDAAPQGQTFEVLNTLPPNPAGDILFKYCAPPNAEIPVPVYGNQIEVDLTSNSCGLMTNNKKYWGCLAVESRVYNDINGSSLCGSTVNPCLIYIKPAELQLADIEVTGTCRDYFLTAKPEGGGWKEVNGKYMYQEYLWEATDWRSGQKLDVLEEVPGQPDKRRIKLDHPYFKKFGYNQYVEFMVKLVVNDYANHSIEKNELVSLNPFRLHLKEAYTRCPGVQSKFSDTPLASGGSGSIYANEATAYTFTWSPSSLVGHDPTFTAPNAGAASANYHVTVADGTCVLTAITTVTSVPLITDVLPASTQACVTNGLKTIGPANLQNLGGSGTYTFEWMPTTNLSDPTVSNPVVQNMPQNTTYTLKVTDLYGGCSKTDQIDVISHANTLQVSITGPSTLCHREEAVLFAHVDGPNPPANQFVWSSTNRFFKPPVNSADQVSLNQTINSASGQHMYTVRYSDPATGCYKDASKTVTVREAWQVKGYDPVVGVAVVGQEADLWQAGSLNSITGGFVPPLSFIWIPQDPLSVMNNTGSNQPRNGKFKPTFEVPYLTMRATDGAGCVKDFKTKRYLLTDLTPEFDITCNPNEIVCAGEKICFEIAFDAHVSDQNLNLATLPQELRMNYQIIDGLPSNIPHQTGVVVLTLANAGGLYKGALCRNTVAPPTTGLNTPLAVELQTVGVPVFGYKEARKEFYVIQPNSLPASGNVTYCVLNNGSAGWTALSINLGKLPCSYGTTMHDPGQIRAKNFIEILPEANIELSPSPSPGANGVGPHLLINPCLTPVLVVVSSKPSDTIALEQKATTGTLGEDRSAQNEIHNLSALDLSLRPNPFTAQILIDYQLQTPEPTRMTLRVLNVTGQALQVVFKDQPRAPGPYQSTFDGDALPAGVYWFELSTENGLKTTKRAIKTKI